MYEDLFRERGLSLDRLHALVVVADAGSIARAARGDPVRQSQLSRQLSELESFFGLALTERRGGRRVLTADGERLVEVSRWALGGLSDVKAGRRGSVAAPLVLAAGDSVLAWWVLPRIARLASRFTVVAMARDDLLEALAAGRVDVGVVRKDETGALESRSLGEIEHALFVPRAIVPRGVSDDDLPFVVPIALQTSDADFVARMNGAAARRGKKLDVRLRCETFVQVFHAVRSEHVGGLLPTIAKAELPAGRFREVTFGGRHASALRLAWSPRLTRVRPEAEKAIEQLAQALDARR